MTEKEVTSKGGTDNHRRAALLKFAKLEERIEKLEGQWDDEIAEWIERCQKNEERIEELEKTINSNNERLENFLQEDKERIEKLEQNPLIKDSSKYDKRINTIEEFVEFCKHKFTDMEEDILTNSNTFFHYKLKDDSECVHNWVSGMNVDYYWCLHCGLKKPLPFNEDSEETGKGVTGHGSLCRGKTQEESKPDSVLARNLTPRTPSEPINNYRQLWEQQIQSNLKLQQENSELQNSLIKEGKTQSNLLIKIGELDKRIEDAHSHLSDIRTMGYGTEPEDIDKLIEILKPEEKNDDT
jgi:hypothetical protein